MKNVQISLILACYNQQPLTEWVLSSALNQKVDASYEVIICDDGSSDNLFEVVQHLTSSSDVDVRYVWQPDRGFRAGRSRNNGIRCAQGRILVFVDGDIWMMPTFLRDHWRAHTRPRSLVCGMVYTLMAAKSDVPALDLAQLTELVAQPQEEHVRQRQWLLSDSPWMACLGGNFSMPRVPDLYFDESFETWGSEDREFAYRVFKSGLTPRTLNAPNAVQVRFSDVRSARLDHEGVTNLLRNKTLLSAKYPDGAMAPSLGMVRSCHLDPATQRWSMGAVRHDVSVDHVLEEFRAWETRALAAPRP
jgi:glycosyltransferase involved in cell wall biosynthesis